MLRASASVCSTTRCVLPRIENHSTPAKSRAAGTAALVGPIIVVGLGALRGWVPSGRVFRTVLFTLLVLMLISPLIYTRFQQAQVGTGAEGVRAPLVETAFVSNPEDEMKLMDDEFRKEVAERIVEGVQEFLDYCDE